MRILVCAMFVTFFCGLNSGLHARVSGSFAGGGSDRLENAIEHAIYTNNQTVEWCILDGGIGVSYEVLKAEVEGSLEQWQAYTKGKDVHEVWKTPKNVLTTPIPALTFKQHYNETCDVDKDGEVDDKINLTIYAGVENEQITKRKEKFFDPVSFSIATSYDDEKGLGKGLIWIQKGEAKDKAAKDQVVWEYVHNLRGILLHELGHLLGCGHIDGTIMRGDLARVIVGYGREKRPEVAAASKHLLTNIDFSQELYYSLNTGILLHDVIDTEKDPKAEILKDLYKRFTKKDLVGKEIFLSLYEFKEFFTGGEKAAALIIADEASVRAAKASNDPNFLKLMLALDTPEEEDVELLTPEKVFVRRIKNVTYDLHSVRVSRRGRIIGVEYQRKRQEADLPIDYVRNFGRFSHAGNYNKTLVRLRLLETGEPTKVLFNAAFDDQAQYPYGFYQWVGGLSIYGP